MSKQRAERFQLGKFYLAKKSSSPHWRICWFDEERRQVAGFSTGTPDFEQAKGDLARHYIAESELKDERPEDVFLFTVLDRYYDKHASKLPSKGSAKSAIEKWKEFWGPQATLADLTIDAQEKFVAWLEAYVPTRGAAKGKAKLSRATISTQISTGIAAINFAIDRHEIKSAPKIIPYKHKSRRKRVLSLDEMAALLNAAADVEHMWRWFLLAIATASRPNAVLELRVTPPMLDLDNGLIDLLPPEIEIQDDTKRRPIVPIAPTLLPWLRLWTQREALVRQARRGKKVTHVDRLITWRGKPIKKIRMGFERIKERAGITDPKVVPVAIRHTMITWLIKRKVHGDQREIFIGHQLPGSETTAGYVHLEPDYLSEAVAAIDAYLIELSGRLNRPLRASCVPLPVSGDAVSS